MVPVRKMDQLGRRTLQYLLLCLLWTMAIALPGSPQYSSMGIYQASSVVSAEDQGEILLFIIGVVIHKIGKKLDRGYKCPVYCDVSHKHIYWENYETEESNISPDDGLPGSDKPQDREQPEGSIRPIASAD